MRSSFAVPSMAAKALRLACSILSSCCFLDRLASRCHLLSVFVMPRSVSLGKGSSLRPLPLPLPRALAALGHLDELLAALDLGAFLEVDCVIQKPAVLCL